MFVWALGMVFSSCPVRNNRQFLYIYIHMNVYRLCSPTWNSMSIFPDEWMAANECVQTCVALRTCRATRALQIAFEESRSAVYKAAAKRPNNKTTRHGPTLVSYLLGQDHALPNPVSISINRSRVCGFAFPTHLSLYLRY